MMELSLLALEMERQGKRLNRLLRVGHPNTLTWPEFQDLVAIIERLQVNLTDFNVRHFGPQIPLEEPKKKRPPRLMFGCVESRAALWALYLFPTTRLISAGVI